MYSKLIAVIAVAMCGASQAAPEQRPMVLAARIGPEAQPGGAVTLTDGQCNYAGTLVREAPAKGVATSTLELAGVDAGSWSIQVSREVCNADGGAIARPVALRIALPHPPALAGGGGVPPAPGGYEAGRRFVAVSK
jgi:hypothetical protein